MILAFHLADIIQVPFGYLMEALQGEIPLAGI